jgi:hypothetical protein
LSSGLSNIQDVFLNEPMSIFAQSIGAVIMGAVAEPVLIFVENLPCFG